MRIDHQIQNDQPHRKGGFTLFETIIVLIIIGIMMSSLAFIVKTALASLREDQSNRVLVNAQRALENLTLNSKMGARYPCPARPTLSLGDPNYGYEDCTLASVAGARNTASAANEYEQKSGNVLVGYFPDYMRDKDGNWVTTSSFLPKEDLIQFGLRDPWGHRLIYAISENMTGANGANNTNEGQIRIVDESGNDTGGIRRDAFYVLISQGQYADADCQANSPARPYEYENCDFHDFPDATFKLALTGKSVDATYFDDKLVFMAARQKDLWKATSTDVSPALTGNIGIGTTQPSERLDVAGRVRSERSVRAGKICDRTGANCFDPEDFMKLKCDVVSGNTNYVTYMKGVYLDASNALKPVCQTLTLNPPSTGIDPCPSHRVRGIWTNGTISCAP